MLTKSDPVAVVGAVKSIKIIGPTGLAAALMLAKRGYNKIDVYDRLTMPASPDDINEYSNLDRSYMIGVTGRGQILLDKLGVMPTLDAYSAMVRGRKDWAPGTPPDKPREVLYTIKDKSYVTRSISRDRLTAVLLDVIRKNFNDSIAIHYEVECVNLKLNSNPNMNECKCTLFLQQSSDSEEKQIFTKDADLVIGADGISSTIRKTMESFRSKRFKTKIYDDRNVRVYRSIPIYFNKHMNEEQRKKWRLDLNYSIRTKYGINLEALPTKEGPYVGVALYRPSNVKICEMKTKEDARRLFEEYFPQWLEFITDEDLEKFSQKKDSKFPFFAYCGPDLHWGDCIVLLGDTIHSVKPYFGLGVNSAFEDVTTLEKALDETAMSSEQESSPADQQVNPRDNISKALKLFSQWRYKDAKTLVEMSHRLDGGFFSFLFPLIVDIICHQYLPMIFAPNTLNILQNEKLTFSEIRFRKRIDRVMQFFLGSLLSVLLFKFCRSIWYKRAKYPRGSMS